MNDKISIEDAAAKGIERIRKEIWANPMDHLKIDIIGGCPGPWVHLYSPANSAINEAITGKGNSLHTKDHLPKARRTWIRRRIFWPDTRSSHYDGFRHIKVFCRPDYILIILSEALHPPNELCIPAQ